MHAHTRACIRTQVRMVLKCPPKPMLPDTTRVRIRHRLQRTADGTLTLEREIFTLDVPYGETFSVQERWMARRDHSSTSDSDSELTVHAHVHFKSRALLANKIRTHALKKSRKCAVTRARSFGRRDPRVWKTRV